MIYDKLKKYKNLIVISILILIILFIYFKEKKEHLIVNSEYIFNIPKIYANASETAVFNNLKVNKLMVNNIDISGIITVNYKDISNNNIDSFGNIIFNNTDISGSLKIIDNNIDISGNTIVNNLKIINNLDISGTLNILKNKTYYTCTYNGQLNYTIFTSSHMNILSNKYFTNKEITSKSNHKNNTISINVINGELIGFDKDKTYKLEAYIHIYMNEFMTLRATNGSWVSRWIRGNSGEELSNVLVNSNSNTRHVTLSTIIFASGSESYTLTLQKNGTKTFISINASISIAITEL